MSVRCRSCGYLIQDPWANGCPLCGAPYEGGGGGGRGGGGGGGGSRGGVYALLGIVAVLFIGGTVLNRVNGRRADPMDDPPERLADSTGRIRVGMHMNDVGRQLDSDLSRRRTDPNSLAAKFPEGMTRSGMLVWVRDTRVLFVRFDRGRVSAVDEGEGNPGTEEVQQIMYDDDGPPRP